MRVVYVMESVVVVAVAVVVVVVAVDYNSGSLNCVGNFGYEKTLVQERESIHGKKKRCKKGEFFVRLEMNPTSQYLFCTKQNQLVSVFHL